ncbi:MAG: DUF4279 domain-containing protein [Thioalkalivibrio sp.]|nr:DUF4279 domain-containing protein [Thioalkalivibrio sp.]
MKRPKPTIPNGAPPGTEWFGGPIEWFVLSLSLTSENLAPADITLLLGCEPDVWWQKGDRLGREAGGVQYVRRFGIWGIEARPGSTDEWDCEVAMMDLLKRVPSDVVLWRELAKRYEIRAKFAVHMASKNEAFELSPDTLVYLGERQMVVEIDVYADAGDRVVAADA